MQTVPVGSRVTVVYDYRLTRKGDNGYWTGTTVKYDHATDNALVWFDDGTSIWYPSCDLEPAKS